MDYTLLNTRPLHQAQTLNAMIEADGGQSLSCPLMQIEWLPPDADVLQGLTASTKPFDKAIFTSANAVQGWQQWCKEHAELAKKIIHQGIAIGQATQKKARQQGLELTCLSQQKFDSEHLLQHPSMLDLSGQRIVLVTGENGRKVLRDSLRERGAEVIEVFVYRRQTAEFCPRIWQQFLNSPHPVLLISSLQAWQQLLAHLRAKYQYEDMFNPSLNQQIWQAIDAVLVYSERIAKELKQDGYKGRIEVLNTQTDQGVLQTIQSL